MLCFYSIIVLSSPPLDSSLLGFRLDRIFAGILVYHSSRSQFRKRIQVVLDLYVEIFELIFVAMFPKASNLLRWVDGWHLLFDCSPHGRVIGVP